MDAIYAAVPAALALALGAVALVAARRVVAVPVEDQPDDAGED